MYTYTIHISNNLYSMFIKSSTTVYGSDISQYYYEGWNFNSDNYLFTTDTK